MSELVNPCGIGCSYKYTLFLYGEKYQILKYNPEHLWRHRSEELMLL